MSQDNIQTALSNLGFSRSNARVYIYLAKKGPKKASEIAKNLKMTKQQLYPIIKSLQKRGVVTSTLERPARFSAVQFEKIIDLFTKVKMEELKRIQKNKNTLLEDWRSIFIKETEEKTEKFSVLEGKKFIYSKIQQMIQETNKKLSIIFPLSSLIKLDQYGIFDCNILPKKSKVNFQVLTELTNQNLRAGKTFLKTTSKNKFKIRARNPNLGLKLFPPMVIRDEDEILLFISTNNGTSVIEKDENSLWTNCKSIINSFQCVFDELWKNSTDLQTKDQEIENGKQKTTKQITPDLESVEKTIDEIISSAQTKITMAISAKSLLFFSKKVFRLKKLETAGIQVRIMAPITRENIGVIQHLPKFCKVRHISETNIETILADGKQLLQFELESDSTQKKSVLSFTNIFYSNDITYVDKIEQMLNNLWTNARSPSMIPLEAILQPQSNEINNTSENFYTYSKPDSPYRKLTTTYEEKPGTVTEKEVLNKLKEGKNHLVKNLSKDIAVFYGRRAGAVIHTPDYFKLPEMIIHITHWNENSSFGTENSILIRLLLETPHGNRFVPVAFIQDHLSDFTLIKEVYAGTPAEENIQVFNKDEFQILVYGNTIFAGWTKPIILVQKKYTLPPACIMFEGYGNVKTGIIEAHIASGRKQIWEYNGFEAFVTFFHPSSKYSGPGTDGTFSRDVILTSIPTLDNKDK